MSDGMRLNRAPTPKNPPELMRSVKVRCLKPFCVKGKPLAIKDECELDYYVARDLAAIGKCEILK